MKNMNVWKVFFFIHTKADGFANLWPYLCLPERSWTWLIMTQRQNWTMWVRATDPIDKNLFYFLWQFEFEGEVQKKAKQNRKKSQFAPALMLKFCCLLGQPFGLLTFIWTNYLQLLCGLLNYQYTYWISWGVYSFQRRTHHNTVKKKRERN